MGSTVLARGYRCRLGELDLVCRDDRALVIVEVRARSPGRCARRVDSIDIAQASSHRASDASLVDASRRMASGRDSLRRRRVRCDRHSRAAGSVDQERVRRQLKVPIVRGRVAANAIRGGAMDQRVRQHFEDSIATKQAAIGLAPAIAAAAATMTRCLARRRQDLELRQRRVGRRRAALFERAPEPLRARASRPARRSR